MNLLTPLALIGLISVPILVVLHLRGNQPRVMEIPSLLLWQGLIDETRQKARRLRLPSLPLLLLQLLAVILLVGGLARPVSSATPIVQRAEQVFVVDDSVWMSATDLAPNRLDTAKGIVNHRIAQSQPGTLFAIVVASSQPYLLISSTDPARVQRALATVQPTEQSADFTTALRLAAGVLGPARKQRAHLTVLHALENTEPSVTGLPATFSSVPIGRSTDDQGILHFSVRCPVSRLQPCGAFATIANDYSQVVRDTLVIRGDGDVLTRQPLALEPHVDTNLSFAVPPGQRVVQLDLSRADILPADNTAWYVVGSNPHPQVTLIGEQSRITSLRKALEALPNVSLRIASPNQYSAATAARSDLTILDGWRPPGPLPPAPSVVLVDPPSLPGGHVAAAPVDATISGEDTSSPLLTNVDLTSVDVPPQAARVVTMPPWSSSVVWDAQSPLISAGSIGGQRVAILAFDPSLTNLPQLSAYPLLLWNIVQWSLAWLPTGAVPGESIVFTPAPATTGLSMVNALSGKSVTALSLGQSHLVALPVPRAGAFAVTQRAAGGSHTALVAANPDMVTSSASGTLRLALVPGQGVSVISKQFVPWWPWIGLVALIAMLAEWLYVARREA